VEEGLEALLQRGRLWRAGHGLRAGVEAIPSGFSELDACLPGGGWPRAALTELLLDEHGRGELALVLPALVRLCQAAEGVGAARWVCWVAPPFMPYAPALAARGLPPEHMLVVHPPRRRRPVQEGAEPLWAAEQALRSGQCCAVLIWADALDGRQLRRLQLAAEASDAWAVLFRSADARRQASPAALRLHLDRQGLSILKCRGGQPTRLSSWSSPGVSGQSG
jgi:hypothetical protein